MNNKYINIYNNLVNLTRNKKLYENFDKQDTFSDRLIFLLLHFAFFLKVYKKDTSKGTMQEIFDFFFRQLELSIREIGYGDASINKKMKIYVNLLFDIIKKIENWENIDSLKKQIIFSKYINIDKKNMYILDYFDKYLNYLKNNTLNSLLKGVIKLNF